MTGHFYTGHLMTGPKWQEKTNFYFEEALNSIPQNRNGKTLVRKSNMFLRSLFNLLKMLNQIVAIPITGFITTISIWSTVFHNYRSSRGKILGFQKGPKMIQRFGLAPNMLTRVAITIPIQ